MEANWSIEGLRRDGIGIFGREMLNTAGRREGEQSEVRICYPGTKEGSMYGLRNGHPYTEYQVGSVLQTGVYYYRPWYSVYGLHTDIKINL